MKFTDIFVRRPVLAIVVNLVILIAGIQAIRTLNVRQYPKLESASVTVKTAYVGASADLVRGFITTPLERAIAAADGIDYIESQSTQGLSTISVRLKLNFNAGNALADISARVNQVRADLPPEAEIPAINIEPSDAAFAAMYLSFGSDILEENQVTDYLIRVVQPRLSAIEGVQRADILGARTFAIRAWLKPDRMAALNVSPAQVRAALAVEQLPLGGGPDQGPAGAGEPHRVDGPEVGRRVPEAGGPRAERHPGAPRRRGRGRARRRDLRPGGALLRREGRVHGRLGVAERQLARRHRPRRTRRWTILQKELPSGMKAKVAFDSTKYINSAIDEVVHTLLETVLIVSIVIFLFLGSLRTVLVPIVAIPVSLIGAVFLMQVFGFTREPADPAGHRALGGPGGRRRHRRGRERRATHARAASPRSTRRWSARASWSARSSR